jgi:hypothetical protein
VVESQCHVRRATRRETLPLPLPTAPTAQAAASRAFEDIARRIYDLQRGMIIGEAMVAKDAASNVVVLIFPPKGRREATDCIAIGTRLDTNSRHYI